MVCNKCGQEKSDEEFLWRDMSKGIRRKDCKACKRERRREWYSEEANRKIESERMKGYRRPLLDKRLQWKINYIESHGGCSYDGCEVTHPAMIDFDHIDPSTKSDSIARMMGRGRPIEEIEKEAAKCVLLCANHHRLRTVEQYGWYASIEALTSNG